MRRDLDLKEKMSILKAYDALEKMSQRRAALKLKIAQPTLSKILNNRSEIEIAFNRNENPDRKKNR